MIRGGEVITSIDLIEAHGGGQVQDKSWSCEMLEL